MDLKAAITNQPVLTSAPPPPPAFEEKHLRPTEQRALSAEQSSPHVERHTSHGDLVRNSIIGFADGLTVPFALTAGLSALGSSRLVILGGLAELFAGAISMGLGAYLAAVTERKHYEVEERRERREIAECPAAEEEEIYGIFAQYGIARAECQGVVEALKANEDSWVRFMMDFELKLEAPRAYQAMLDGVVMGLSYFLGKIVEGEDQLPPPAGRDGRG
nr:vacuolar iron transporter 1 [Quercus suber]